MISSLLMEAALRSVLLALAVWIGLRVFAVRNVLAQKVAWGLVLGSAMAMPIVLPMTEHWSVLPANVRVVIPADPETLLEELQARIQAKTAPEIKPSAIAAPVAEDTASAGLPADSEDQPAAQGKRNAAILQANADADEAVQSDHAAQYPAAASSQSSLSITRTSQPERAMEKRLTPLQLAGLVYLLVAGVLCARLLYGLLVALHVWRSAKPVLLQRSALTEGLQLRVSDSISSPVTIGSAVLLPKGYDEWESEKLRIVLAHERSHVRQGDFYLQLMAGVYAALVWFSPLGWWLKRTLSDLAEAISDRAGLEEAPDRAAYAQVLLEFAAAPRPTLIGVAMARSGSLSRRIERLLNDATFRQAFAGTRRGLVAVVVIPLAMFAATALVRVEAAGQQAPPSPSAITPPPAAPEAGVSNPELTGAVGQTPEQASAPQAPETAVTPKPAENWPPEGVVAVPAPALVPGVPAGVPAPPAVAPVPPAHAPAVMILQGQPGIATLALSSKLSLRTPMVVVPRVATIPAHTMLAIVAPQHAYGEGHGYGVGQSTSGTNSSYSSNGKKSGYHDWSSDGDSYAVVRGNDKENLTFSGNWTDGWREQIDKARRQAGGKDFLWFTRDGKAYFVDDPTTLAQVEAMYKPMEELGRQQEELGKKQEALGKQQEELGKQQESASVPTPDMSKEIAKIEEAMTKLKASQGKNMTQDEFGDLQEKLGELQGRLGEIQGQIGEKQGEFGARMGELGEKMGALGSQMGELGARQGKMAQDVDQRVHAMIEESLKNSKAHQVQ